MRERKDIQRQKQERSGNQHICLAKFSHDKQHNLPFVQYPFYVFKGNNHEKEKIRHISLPYFYCYQHLCASDCKTKSDH